MTWARLYESQKLSDVTLLVGEEEVRRQITPDFLDLSLAVILLFLVWQ